ncbi:hypothetical protein LA76x_5182 [Lysobacter antibioticus]|uniref:Uncharacterized protein n=2 Tax=Lysobacter antibioticus TaxID=84531 RepID=A0A0S2FI65_LYSAN|nr:hypothetical protein LA76x_5182 [Lysobacter antibioticus]
MRTRLAIAMQFDGGRPAATGDTMPSISAKAAFALACAGACLPMSASAQPPDGPFDFPPAAFKGGNTDWSIRLKRTAPGEVDFVFERPRGAETGRGSLASVAPELKERGLRGKYGLSGTATIAGEPKTVTVLVAPSTPHRRCRDRNGVEYGSAVLIIVGGGAWQGCGEFD